MPQTDELGLIPGIIQQLSTTGRDTQHLTRSLALLITVYDPNTKTKMQLECLLGLVIKGSPSNFTRELPPPPEIFSWLFPFCSSPLNFLSEWITGSQNRSEKESKERAEEDSQPG